MSDEYHINSKEQEEGSIGIGAMIVFIALILVAAVASTIIIKTAEELQQNAESTSDDTRKEISGKISVIQIIVNGSDGTDIDSMILTAKVASGSTDVLVNNIDFMVTCGDASNFGLVTGNLGTDAPWGQPITETDAAGTNLWTAPNAETLAGVQYTATTELTAGTVFKFDVNFDRDYLGGAGDGPCAELAGVGETLQLKLIVDGGGTTISELSIDSVVSGKAVV
jgi:flagellin FlaB